MISIIAPCYNVEKYIDACVASVLAQTRKDWELLLVDDGAKDKTGAMCDAWALKDPRIRVIHRENGGLSAARNTGIPEAKGEWIFFLDSDDYLPDNALELLLETAQKEDSRLVMGGFIKKYPSHAEQVFCGTESAAASEDTESSITSYTANDLLAQWHDTYKHIETMAWGKLYHRSLFFDSKAEGEDQVIYFPEGKVHEDIMTTHLLVSRAKRISILSACVYYYRMNDQSITRKPISMKNIVDHTFAQEVRAQFFKENGYEKSYHLLHLQTVKGYVLFYCKGMRAGLKKEEYTAPTQAGGKAYTCGIKELPLELHSLRELRDRFKKEYPQAMKEAGIAEKGFFTIFRLCPGVVTHLLLPLYERNS